VSASGDKGFNATISQCIDRALRSTLGDGSTQAIYFMIGDTFDLHPDQFASKPQQLMDALHKVLGDAGYALIEKVIAREIRRTFSLDDKLPSLNAVIEEARKEFLSDSHST
jgi:hypothetical protein